MEGGYIDDWHELMQRDRDQGAPGGDDLPPPEALAPGHTVRRDFRIARQLVQRFGATPGCRSCLILSGARAGKLAGQTAACRIRFEEVLAKDDKLKNVLKRRDVRHGLMAGNDSDDDDDDPPWKRARLIEDPPAGPDGSAGTSTLFAPSELTDSER